MTVASKPMDDPVQQLSEKRTCVTTTPLRCHPSDTPETAESSRDSSFTRLDTIEAQQQQQQQQKQQQTTPGFRFYILNSSHRAGDQQHYLQQLPHSTKVRPVSKKGVFFTHAFHFFFRLCVKPFHVICFVDSIVQS